MKLLIEEASEVQTLVEEKDGGKRNHYIRGVFAEADTLNRNGRKYPLPILTEAIEAYKTNRINAKRAWGELSHPASPTINHERVCLRITEMSQNGNQFIGKAIITEGTPMGKIVIGLIECGGEFGVSTRGLGSLVESNGVKVVQKDFCMEAVDVVDNASAPGASRVSAIMENTDWFLDAFTGEWRRQELIEQTVKNIHKQKKLDEAQAVLAFDKFIKSLISEESDELLQRGFGNVIRHKTKRHIIGSIQSMTTDRHGRKHITIDGGFTAPIEDWEPDNSADPYGNMEFGERKPFIPSIYTRY